jgi:hypothetical protein
VERGPGEVLGWCLLLLAGVSRLLR